MEGDLEIQKIIYTNGWYSTFDEVGEEHLFNEHHQEQDVEEDVEWEDPMDISGNEDIALDESDPYFQQSMKVLEEDEQEQTTRTPRRKNLKSARKF